LTGEDQNKIYGLVGKNISYSFSGKYFAGKFAKEKIKNTTYEIFDLNEISEIEKLIQEVHLDGFNVTIPYKEQILPYLDGLTQEAAETGAVNCVKIQNERKVGYNTDVFGFEESLRPLLEPYHQNALVLGSGGATKAIIFVLKKLNISFKTVSRNGIFTYKDLNREEIEKHQIIINCTPVGTFPETGKAPEIPYEFLTAKHFLYDLVYNPEKTKFLQFGEQKNAKIKNGLEMLRLQAEKSWEIWSRPL